MNGKKNYRNFKLVTALFESIKKVSDNLPMYLPVTSGLNIDPVFNKLGFIIIPIATTISSWLNGFLLLIFVLNKNYFCFKNSFLSN